MELGLMVDADGRFDRIGKVGLGRQLCVETGAPSGFGLALLVRITALGVPDVRAMLNRAPGTYASGYVPYAYSDDKIYFGASAGALVTSPAYQMTAADLNRLTLIIGWHDGTKVRLMINRVQVADGSAIGGFTPYSGPTTFSGSADAPVQRPATSIDQLSGLTFRGTPTVAQLQALCDATKVLGDVPTTFTGATVTHRWSLRTALTGTSVTNGQAAPATIADSITNAAPDLMARTGTPTVAVIPVTTPGLWAF